MLSSIIHKANDKGWSVELKARAIVVTAPGTKLRFAETYIRDLDLPYTVLRLEGTLDAAYTAYIELTEGLCDSQSTPQPTASPCTTTTPSASS